jgi:hypothetical protein
VRSRLRLFEVNLMKSCCGSLILTIHLSSGLSLAMLETFEEDYPTTGISYNVSTTAQGRLEERLGGGGRLGPEVGFCARPV